MKKEMRRKERRMNEKDSLKVLNNAKYGVLSTIDTENNPYGVPISYVLFDGNIYLHCAMQGSKIDNINYNDNICFSVVGNTKPIYDKQFTTYFESVIIFGKAEIIEDNEEKALALTKLCEKYLPNDLDKLDEAIKMSISRTCIIKLTPEQITGKEKKAMQ